MARATTTADIFTAIAEPRRRDIIDMLSDGDQHAVGEMVLTLNLPQPAVSKHLGVLRKVGVVVVAKQGQRRMYRLNPAQIKPVHDWSKAFEHFWAHQLDRIAFLAEQRAAEQRLSEPPSNRKDLP